MADDQVNTDEVNTEQVNTEPLRNASPLPESDTESEVSFEEEQAPIPQHVVVWQYTQHYGVQALLWLQVLWNFLSYLTTTSKTVGVSVIRSLQTQMYVFFKGSHYPYRMQDYTITGPGIAPVEWYYNADTKVFTSNLLYNTSTEYETHHFEWLTGQIKYNDLVLYDISDFLQQIRWAGTTRPSIAYVLAAWSLDSGKVLNSVDGLTLQTINADGTESNLACRG